MDKPLYSDSLAKLFLRIAVGGLMLLHGIHKIRYGVGSIEGMLADSGLPTAMAYGVYLGEVVAPIMILLGFLTRLGGLVLAFTMLMSIYLGFGAGFWELDQFGGSVIEVNLLYFAGGMALFFSGGGRFGVTHGEGKWS